MKASFPREKVLDARLFDTTRKAYLPLLAAQPPQNIVVHRDLSYGPHEERNLLDVHAPPADFAGPLPSVVFFHGGKLLRGHKNAEGELVYGNIANFFAARGIIGVNATHRIAPDAVWPEAADDVAAALSWTRERIERYGGDPGKIFLMGHSAGASHVASFVFRKSLQPGTGSSCAGTILCSGAYSINRSGVTSAYWGPDPSTYATKQVIGNIDVCDTPVLITVAEYDPKHFNAAADALSDELGSFRCRRRRLLVREHNHVSQIYAVGTPDDVLGDAIIDFIFAILRA